MASHASTSRWARILPVAGSSSCSRHGVGRPVRSSLASEEAQASLSPKSWVAHNPKGISRCQSCGRCRRRGRGPAPWHPEPVAWRRSPSGRSSPPRRPWLVGSRRHRRTHPGRTTIVGRRAPGARPWPARTSGTRRSPVPVVRAPWPRRAGARADRAAACSRDRPVSGHWRAPKVRHILRFGSLGAHQPAHHQRGREGHCGHPGGHPQRSGAPSTRRFPRGTRQIGPGRLSPLQDPRGARSQGQLPRSTSPSWIQKSPPPQTHSSPVRPAAATRRDG